MNNYNMGINQIPQMNPYQEKFDRYMNLQQNSLQNQQIQQQSQTNMNFVVVENIQKAREQIVPYGYTMWMRDSSEPYQYIKSVDNVGTPTFRVLKVEDVTDKINVVNDQQQLYVSFNDFNSLNDKVDKLQEYVENMQNDRKTAKPKEKVGEQNV